MDLLFKRSQTSGGVGAVKFQLWGMIELSKTEQDLVKKYKFDQAVLIESLEPGLVKKVVIVAAIAIAVFMIVLGALLGEAGLALGFIAGLGCAYYYYHQSRETVFVKDLLHGRYFTCDSVVDLARKEAWLETVCGYLRQVMESARNWDGTDRHKFEPLPKEEARSVILRGI